MKVLLTDEQRRAKFGELFTGVTVPRKAHVRHVGNRKKDNPDYHAERSRLYRQRIKEEKYHARFHGILDREHGVVHIFRGGERTMRIEISFLQGEFEMVTNELTDEQAIELLEVAKHEAVKRIILNKVLSGGEQPDADVR